MSVVLVLSYLLFHILVLLPTTFFPHRLFKRGAEKEEPQVQKTRDQTQAEGEASKGNVSEPWHVDHPSLSGPLFVLLGLLETLNCNVYSVFASAPTGILAASFSLVSPVIDRQRSEGLRLHISMEIHSSGFPIFVLLSS